MSGLSTRLSAGKKDIYDSASPPKLTPSSNVAAADTGPNDEIEKCESHLAPPDNAPDAFPDGGLIAWLTVFGATLLQFVSSGYNNAFGVYQDYLVETFLTDFSSSQISWIGSTATFLLLTGSIFSGRLFDAGYFYSLLIIGGFLLVLCLSMLSLAHPQQFYQVYLTLGFGYGLGAAALYVPSVAIVSHHFRRKRALAMGIAASGSSLGSILHPLMLNNLFHGSTGFANGVRVSGGLVAGCMIIAVLTMRPRLPPRKSASVSLLSAANKFMKDDVYVLTILGMFLGVQGIFFPLFYIQLYSDTHGIDPTFGFYTVTILSFASFLGRIAGGAVVNRAGVFNAITFSSFATTALIFAMLGLQDTAGVVVFCLLYGFFSGAYISLWGPMLASLAMDVSEVGARMGIAFAAAGLGSLIGTPIPGALLSKNFVWWRPVVYGGTVTGAGAGFSLLCRFILAKRKGTGWV